MFITSVIFFLVLTIKTCKSDEELAEPHLIVIGATGTGKSSLANVLIGESPDCENCTFPICSGTDSCTKQTAYAEGHWLGNGELFTIVDTPGFGDSDNDDNDLMNEMVQALKNAIKTANGFLLLFNGQSERFDIKAQQMIREMEALFGEAFWDYTVLGVSFWAYDQNSINQRNYTGKTEDWWTGEMNRQLKQKFHLETDLSAVFIDSFAKQPWNLNDVLQQEAFTRETSKLWEIFSSNPQFEFKTIQDIIDELNECQLENDCLNGEIQEELSRLSSELESTKAKNQEQDIEIDNLEDKISDFDKFPLGTILPWINRPELDTLHHEEFPAGWVLCDGVWKGKHTPNLNGEGRFLRGGHPGEVLTLEDHMIKDHTHLDNGHSHTDAGHTHSYQDCGSGLMTIDGHDYDAALYACKTKTTESGHANIQQSKSNHAGVEAGNKGEETRPVNMRVIWIMKVW